MCSTSDYCVIRFIWICLYLTCLAGIGVLGAEVWYEVTYSPLLCAFGLVTFVIVVYSKVFKLQNGFLKNFCGPLESTSLWVVILTRVRLPTLGSPQTPCKRDHTGRLLLLSPSISITTEPYGMRNFPTWRGKSSRISIRYFTERSASWMENMVDLSSPHGTFCK